jgi:hypothetical protein
MLSSTSSVVQLGILSSLPGITCTVCETVLCVAQGPVPVHPQLPEVLYSTCRSRYDSKLVFTISGSSLKDNFFSQLIRNAKVLSVTIMQGTHVTFLWQNIVEIFIFLWILRYIGQWNSKLWSEKNRRNATFTGSYHKQCRWEMSWGVLSMGRVVHGRNALGELSMERFVYEASCQLGESCLWDEMSMGWNVTEWSRWGDLSMGQVSTGRVVRVSSDQ